jgi:hypothetical protein
MIVCYLFSPYAELLLNYAIFFACSVFLYYSYICDSYNPSYCLYCVSSPPSHSVRAQYPPGCMYSTPPPYVAAVRCYDCTVQYIHTTLVYKHIFPLPPSMLATAANPHFPSNLPYGVPISPMYSISCIITPSEPISLKLVTFEF